MEHGIGLFGDEWRVGASMDVPIPYWTDPDHVYQENEMVILAMQYAAQEDDVGFRYENPIVITQGRLRADLEVPPGHRRDHVSAATELI